METAERAEDLTLWKLSGEEANKLYEAFVEQCKKEGLKVKTGVFGANMEVNIVNDGPVTYL